MGQKTDRPAVVGVMGGKKASAHHIEMAKKLGEFIAQSGFILLNGGKNSGIMEASAKGSKNKGGLSIGVLPDDNKDNLSQYIDIPIITGIGNARNQINILSSDIVIAFQGGLGTISEIAFAIKMKKPLIIFDFYPGKFIDEHLDKNIFLLKTLDEVTDKIKEILTT